MRLGTQYCPDCDLAIAPQSLDAIVASLQRSFRGQKLQLLAPLIAHRKGHYRELARWAAARGASQLRVDGKWVPTDPFPSLKRFVEHDIELPVASLTCGPREEAALRAAVAHRLELGKGVVRAAGERQTTDLQRPPCLPVLRPRLSGPDPRLLSL